METVGMMQTGRHWALRGWGDRLRGVKLPKWSTLGPRARRAGLVVGILLVGVCGQALMVAMKPEVTREAVPERVWAVDAVSATRADHRPDMKLLGTLVAGRSVELRPMVAGTVKSVSPTFRDGGIVRAGETLLQIDPLDYELQLRETKAQLDEARARLDELRATAAAEKSRAELARQQMGLKERELERHQALFDKGTISIARLETAQGVLAQERQTLAAMENGFQAGAARVRQQEAAIDRLKAQLVRAETDLARTTLTAPFDAFVGQTRAEVGMQVSAGDRVAQLSGAEGLEARVTLSTEAYGRLAADGDGVVGRAAQVVWRLGDTSMSYAATVERVIDRIDTATGGVTIFVRLVNQSVDQPLRPGAFVEVNLPDRAYAGVHRLPVTALHGDDTVYVSNAEDRLVSTKVQVVARTTDAVFVSAGLADGAKVVTTRFQEIGAGLKVAVRDVPPAVTNPDTAPAQQAEGTKAGEKTK